MPSSQASSYDGGVSVGHGVLVLSDSTLATATPNPSLALTNGHATLTRVQIAGVIRFTQDSNVTLFGVTQTSGPQPFVDGSSFVSIGDASPLGGGPPSIPSSVLGLMLRNFANASLVQTSRIDGNLSCDLGANAVCPTPANVSGTTAGCAACVKP